MTVSRISEFKLCKDKICYIRAHREGKRIKPLLPLGWSCSATEAFAQGNVQNTKIKHGGTGESHCQQRKDRILKFYYLQRLKLSHWSLSQQYREQYTEETICLLSD